MLQHRLMQSACTATASLSKGHFSALPHGYTQPAPILPHKVKALVLKVCKVCWEASVKGTLDLLHLSGKEGDWLTGSEGLERRCGWGGVERLKKWRRVPEPQGQLKNQWNTLLFLLMKSEIVFYAFESHSNTSSITNPLTMKTKQNWMLFSLNG